MHDAAAGNNKIVRRMRGWPMVIMQVAGSSQYSATNRNTPVEISHRRRKSQTSEKYYHILYF
jgi:hypothetical protein